MVDEDKPFYSGEIITKGITAEYYYKGGIYTRKLESGEWQEWTVNGWVCKYK